MAWTYSQDPAESDRDMVRFLVGDTDEATPEVQDEEIEAILVEEGDPRLAAATVAEALSAKYARRVSHTTGKTSRSFSDISQHYAGLAQRLRTQGIAGRVSVYAGGLSESEKDTDSQDSDLTQPTFRRRMHDYSGEDGSEEVDA